MCLCTVDGTKSLETDTKKLLYSQIFKSIQEHYLCFQPLLGHPEFDSCF